jgi:hypothetical protein
MILLSTLFNFAGTLTLAAVSVALGIRTSCSLTVLQREPLNLSHCFEPAAL